MQIFLIHSNLSKLQTINLPNRCLTSLDHEKMSYTNKGYSSHCLFIYLYNIVLAQTILNLHSWNCSQGTNKPSLSSTRRWWKGNNFNSIQFYFIRARVKVSGHLPQPTMSGE